MDQWLSSCRARTLSGRRFFGDRSFGTTALRSWRGGRRGWRNSRGAGLASRAMERGQDGTINVIKGAKVIGAFVTRSTFHQGAPPGHQDDEGVHPGRPSSANTGGLDLLPPTHDIGTKGIGFEAVILPVVVGELEKGVNLLRPLLRWKFRVGLREHQYKFSWLR